MILQRRPLGRTGLEVTPICIGTSALGSMPALYGYEVGDDRALETLRATLAGPINFLDTSNNYADGASELRIGAALGEIGGLPEGFVLATKIDPIESDGELDFSGKRARRSFEESCERLGLERLQLLYLHDPERIPFEQAMADDGPVAAMLELRADGRVDHLGVAGGPVELLQRFVRTGHFEAVITHNRYTLIDRSARSLLEECASLEVATVNGAPFGGGILAKGPDARQSYGYRAAPDPVLAAARSMSEACARHGVPLAAAALQFSLREPLIASTIVGVTRPERIDETLALAAIAIPDELWRELETLVPSSDTWLR